MRALLAIVVVLMTGWSGWWWFAAGMAERGARDWLAAHQAAGWQVNHQALAVRGFPNRIDLSLTGLALETPDRRWGWSAPFLQILSLSYKPWHLVVAFDHQQRITTPDEVFTLTAERMQASVVLVPGGDLALDRVQLVAEGVRRDGLRPLTVATFAAAAHPAVDRRHGWRIGLEGSGIAPDPAVMQRLPAGVLDAAGAHARLDAVVTLDAALDRHLGPVSPSILGVQLREARAEWGPIRLYLSGTLEPDRHGLATGRLELRIEGAATLLDLAVASGMITPEQRPLWDQATGAVARPDQPLQLVLNLVNGLVMLGPLVLGPAPRLG